MLRTVSILCGIAFLSLASRAHAEVTKEYQLKAAFLYNFTKFVEWPEAAFNSTTAPIVIGVVGLDPFREEVEKIVRGRKVNGRGISVVKIEEPSGAVAHTIFVAAGEENRIGRDLAALIDRGVLVVGESERFAALGGTVTFTTAGDKVRFEINMSSAERGGLKISSHLQKLAAVVRR